MGTKPMFTTRIVNTHIRSQQILTHKHLSLTHGVSILYTILAHMSGGKLAASPLASRYHHAHVNAYLLAA